MLNDENLCCLFCQSTNNEIDLIRLEQHDMHSIQKKVFFHGTTIPSMKKIMEGIDLTAGKVGELGTGFYVSDSFQYACRMAWFHKRTKTKSKLKPKKRIALFCFENLSLEGKAVVWYNRDKAECLDKQIKEFVKNVEMLVPKTEYFLKCDIAISPILDDLTKSAIQLKIESERMKKYFDTLISYGKR